MTRGKKPGASKTSFFKKKHGFTSDIGDFSQMTIWSRDFHHQSLPNHHQTELSLR